MTPAGTYIITASQIAAVFGMADAVRAVENAFRLYGEGKVQMPPKVYLIFERGDLRTMPVYMPTLGVAGVKNVNVHPHNSSVPTVMATIALVDADNGFPLCIMDGTYLTSLRTGAAGAVAARHLAREDSRAAGFVGAGVQAETQLDGLMVTVPGIREVLVCDVDRAKADRFCEAASQKYGVAAVASGAEEVVRGSDILTTVTPVRRPIVRDAWVRPGTHINAIGADAPGKEELEPAVLQRARIVVDNWEQASHSGEINVPLAKGLITREDITCDIGELVTGQKVGRESPDDITVFDSTGLAAQDISCAYAVYQKLIAAEDTRAALTMVRFF